MSVVKFQSEKEKLLQSIKETFAETEGPNPSRKNLLFWATVACLIGTMIPHKGLNTFFAVAAILSGVAFFSAWRSTKSKITFRGTKPLIVALVFTLQLAGCSGALFSDFDEAPLTLYGELPAYRVGYAHGVSILGVDIGGDLIKKAMDNGQVNKLYGYQADRGFGLICVAKVKVSGT